jgi:hypothetical protein
MESYVQHKVLKTTLQLQVVFRGDVAGRGVTYYTGGKKQINVLCGERPDVMCRASAEEGLKHVRFIYLYKYTILSGGV